MAVTAVCHKLFGTFLKNQLRRKVTELDLPYDTALIADRELPRVHQRAVVRGAHPVKASRVPGVAGGGLGRVTCSQEVIATSMRAARTSRMPLLLAPLGAAVQSVQSAGSGRRRGQGACRATVGRALRRLLADDLEPPDRPAEERVDLALHAAPLRARPTYPEAVAQFHLHQAVVARQVHQHPVGTGGRPQDLL